MKNTSNLHNWFLMKFPDIPGFKARGRPTEELYQYFALPSDFPICLFGQTYGDTRADEKLSAFTDGHRILTGDLINFTRERAETERSVYTLHDMNPAYVEWLEAQGVSPLFMQELS